MNRPAISVSRHVWTFDVGNLSRSAVTALSMVLPTLVGSAGYAKNDGNTGIRLFYSRRRPGTANGLSLSCTARAYAPKPTRHGGCRQGVAEPRPATCNRRDAAHSSVLTSRLGRRASARP